MKTIVKIKLDLCRYNYASLVQAIQNDSETRFVEAQLLSDGKPWKIPPGTTAAVVYRKPDQTKGLYDKLADGTPALEISGTVVTLALTQQMLTVPGKIKAGIVFFDENLNQLTTFPFTVEVEKDPFSGAQESTDYIRLQWLEDQLDAHLRQAKESGEFDGESVSLLEDRVEYQAAESGQIPPLGKWLATIPQTPKGSYLWTRRTKRWSGQDPITDYSVAYQGVDGGIGSVNGIEPGAAGNVTLTAEDVGAADREMVQKLFRTAAPVNLLDNSDFRKPVNQRGKTAYTGNGYTIDRWRLWDSAAKVNIHSGYISFSGGAIFHYIGNVIDAAKIYTSAYKDKDGNVYVLSGKFSESPYDSTGGQNFYIENSGVPTFRIYSKSDGSDKNIVWVALYEGEYTADTLPEYHPKGYATELENCRRYYVRFDNPSTMIGFGFCQTATACRFFIPLTQAMRVSPSIDGSSNFGARGGGAQFEIAPTNIINLPHGVLIDCSGSGLPQNQAMGVYFSPNAFGLSADL